MILSATYSNVDHSAAIILTDDNGAVLVSAFDTPGAWADMLEWGTPAEYTPLPPEKRRVTKWLIIERVAAAGKGASAKALLNMPGNETAYFKWNAPVESVFFDDPDTVAMLQALGLDPVVIMAEG